jgi:hypothetical protein
MKHPTRRTVTARLIAGGYTRRMFRADPALITGRVCIFATPGRLRAMHALLLAYYPVRLVNDGSGPRRLDVLYA